MFDEFDLLLLSVRAARAYVGRLINFGISWVASTNSDSSCFFKVPLLDDYDDRQTFVQTTSRGRGSAERNIDESRSNFNIPSQSNGNKSNRERLIDNLKVRPVTTTPESITTARRVAVTVTKEQQQAKKTKYTPITR